MKIKVADNNDYDMGIHPEVTEIDFRRRVAGNFFRDDRFPNLVELDCCRCHLTKLELNCPSLLKLWCVGNRLTNLELNCPVLQVLWCYNNPLTDLNGIEFCADLKELMCSPSLRESAKILKIHLPGLNSIVYCWKDLNPPHEYSALLDEKSMPDSFLREHEVHDHM